MGDSPTSGCRASLAWGRSLWVTSYGGIAGSGYPAHYSPAKAAIAEGVFPGRFFEAEISPPIRQAHHVE